MTSLLFPMQLRKDCEAPSNFDLEQTAHSLRQRMRRSEQEQGFRGRRRPCRCSSRVFGGRACDTETTVGMMRQTLPVAALMALQPLFRCGNPETSGRSTEQLASRRTAERLFALSGAEQDMETGIHLLRGADISADVEEARRADDCRLIAVMGFTTYVPGFEDGMPPPGFVFVHVEGTSDVLETDLQGEFQELLLKYAERYNRDLVAVCSIRKFPPLEPW